jgi:hypothetical protein
VVSIPVIAEEGLVFQDGTLLRCERDGQAVDLDFSAFVGRRVYGLIAHLPSKSEKGAWGFGSCKLQGTGSCPFGHHHAPMRLLLWRAADEVFEIEEGWYNTRNSGTFPRKEWLIGHRCKILMCPANLEISDAPEGLLAQTQILGEILAKIKNAR